MSEPSVTKRIVTPAFANGQRGSETPTETVGLYTVTGPGPGSDPGHSFSHRPSTDQQLVHPSRTRGAGGKTPARTGTGKAHGDGVSRGDRGTASPVSEGSGSDAPGYLDHIANVVHKAEKPCPGWFVIGTCDNGHRFAKELYCGREWCPVCGQDGSAAHLRRFARWLPKLYQCRSIGYFVFTIPEAARARFKGKQKLGLLAKSATSGDKSQHVVGILASLGFGRGLARWHYFGELSTKYHPHLNVVVEGGRISPRTLSQVKKAWASVLGVDQAVVNYSFTRKPARMVHILKYVCRSTFSDRNWDESLAAELYNFRNMRSWGNWQDRPVWNLRGAAKFEHIEQLGQSLCPLCRHALKWGRRPEPAAWLAAGNWKDLGAGYYLLQDTS